MNNYIYEAKNIERKEFGDMDNNDFIKDILESVCLLKKEGIEFAFTHRKLQEYFAAHCIARVASRNLESLFRRFSYRYSDDVLGLVYDLNPDLFREKYIFPIYKKHRSFFNLKRRSSIVKKYADMTNSFFNADFYGDSRQKHLKRKNGRVAFIHYMGSGEIYHFYQNTRRVWPHYYPGMQNAEKDPQVDHLFFQKIYDGLSKKPDFARLLFTNGTCLLELFDSQGDEVVRLDSFEVDCGETLMAEFVECCAMNLHTFVNSEMAAYNAITGSFDELFGDED